jgi:hypothetical protein
MFAVFDQINHAPVSIISASFDARGPVHHIIISHHQASHPMDQVTYSLGIDLQVSILSAVLGGPSRMGPLKSHRVRFDDGFDLGANLDLIVAFAKWVEICLTILMHWFSLVCELPHTHDQIAV